MERERERERIRVLKSCRATNGRGRDDDVHPVIHQIQRSAIGDAKHRSSRSFLSHPCSDQEREPMDCTVHSHTTDILHKSNIFFTIVIVKNIKAMRTILPSFHQWHCCE